MVCCSALESALAGKSSILMPGDLFNKRMLQIQFLAFLVFILTFYGGIFYKSHLLVFTGLTCLFVVACTYLANAIIIILHKPEKHQV